MSHVTFADDEDQYLVSNPKEVAQILADLAKQKVNFKVSFNHGADVYLTNIITVDSNTHHVFLDIGRDEAFNRRLFSSHEVVFSREDGIKIRWTSQHVSEATLKDGKAIKIALPRDLIRLQRREYFRFSTPIVNPVTCRIPLPEDELFEDVEDDLQLALVDVSLGGIGAIIPDPLHPIFQIGTTFEHCKIGFPDVGTTDLKLKITNITQLHTADGIAKHRIGLQFIEPSRGNEGLISRYVFVLERAEMARISGVK